jgi:hypothetical protein
MTRTGWAIVRERVNLTFGIFNRQALHDMKNDFEIRLHFSFIGYNLFLFPCGNTDKKVTEHHRRA